MHSTLHQAGGVSLRDTLPAAKFFGSDDICVSSCCTDSRQCRTGDLFIALVGPEQDGHDFVDEAVQRGAGAILADRYVVSPIPVCLVDDTRVAYGEVCQALVGDPTDDLVTVGVTGTNGKTITSLLIASILRAAQRQAGVISTLGHHDGLEFKSTAGSPPPTETARLLASMRANGCSHGIVEASSQTLAQRYLSGVQLDAAVLTNIRRDHLDFHGSVRNYRNAKRRLFDQLKPDGFAVINTDDQGSQLLLEGLKCPVLTIGMHSGAELSATVLERHASEQTFMLLAGNENAVVRTQMIGDHHVHNCLSAAAVGLVMGIDLPTVVTGLEAVQQIPGRLERLECGQPFGTFVDYARTPDALAAALKAVRRVTRGRVLCVFGADGGKDADMRPRLGRVVERHAHLGIITNDNPREEAPLEIAHDILDGYEQVSRAHVLPDRQRAIEWALSQARPGDSVVIAGKGDQTSQVIGHRRHHFDDRAVAKRWLYDVGSHTDEVETKTPRLKVYRPTA